jgi:hypothetical protein
MMTRLEPSSKRTWTSITTARRQFRWGRRRSRCRCRPRRPRPPIARTARGRCFDFSGNPVHADKLDDDHAGRAYRCIPCRSVDPCWQSSQLLRHPRSTSQLSRLADAAESSGSSSSRRDFACASNRSNSRSGPWLSATRHGVAPNGLRRLAVAFWCLSERPILRPAAYAVTSRRFICHPI